MKVMICNTILCSFLNSYERHNSIRLILLDVTNLLQFYLPSSSYCSSWYFFYRDVFRCKTSSNAFKDTLLPCFCSLSVTPQTNSHTHTHIHCRTPLNKWPTRAEAATHTTPNRHKWRAIMFSAGFEPVIPATKPPQTYALDRTATGTGKSND